MIINNLLIPAGGEKFCLPQMFLPTTQPITAIITSLLSPVLPAQVIEPMIIFLLVLFSVNNNPRVFIIQSFLPQILQYSAINL